MLAIFPELNQCAEAAQVEELAILVRKYFAGNSATRPSIDMDGVLRDIGVRVCDSPGTQYVGTGLTEDKEGKFQVTFLTAKALSRIERRFLLAHMLGHFFFEVQGKLLAAHTRREGFYESFSPMIRFEQAYYPEDESAEQLSEQIADDFAACLLMPKAMFLKAYETLDDEEKVANLFRVTQQLVKQRYRMLTVRKKASIPGESIIQTYTNQNNEFSKTKPATSSKARPANNELGVAGEILPLSDKPSPSKDERGKGSGLGIIRRIAKKLDDSVEV